MPVYGPWETPDPEDTIWAFSSYAGSMVEGQSQSPAINFDYTDIDGSILDTQVGAGTGHFSSIKVESRRSNMHLHFYIQCLYTYDLDAVEWGGDPFVDPNEGEPRWKDTEFDGSYVTSDEELTIAYNMGAQAHEPPADAFSQAELVNIMESDAAGYEFLSPAEAAGRGYTFDSIQDARYPEDGEHDSATYVAPWEQSPSAAVNLVEFTPADVASVAPFDNVFITPSLRELTSSLGSLSGVHFLWAWPARQTVQEGPMLDGSIFQTIFVNPRARWTLQRPDFRSVYALQASAPVVTITRSAGEYVATWTEPDHEEDITGYDYSIYGNGPSGQQLIDSGNTGSPSIRTVSWSTEPGYSTTTEIYVYAVDAYGPGEEGHAITDGVAPALRMKQRDDGLGIMGHARITNTSDIKNQASSRQLGIRIPERQTYY